MDVGQHEIERRGHEAERPAAEHGAFVVESLHEHAHAAIHLA
jgi:hypothetical protein